MKVLEVAVALMPGALMVALSGCGGGGTGTASTPATTAVAAATTAAPPAVEFKSTVAGVNFDKMTPAMKTDMKTKCGAAFATSLGVNPSQVSIGLSKGSVNVKATVQPAAGQTIDTTKTPVAAVITNAVLAVTGINTAQEAGATISASLPIATPITAALVASTVAPTMPPVVITTAAAAPCNLTAAAEAMKGCVKGLKQPLGGKGAPPSLDVMKAAICTYAQSAVGCVTSSGGSCLNTQFKTLLPQVVAEMAAEAKAKGAGKGAGPPAPTCAQAPQLCELTPGNVCNEAATMLTTALGAANWTCALQCGVAAAPAALSAAKVEAATLGSIQVPAGQTLDAFMQQAVTGKVGKDMAMLTATLNGSAATPIVADVEAELNSTAATPIVADAEKAALTLVNSTLTESIAVAATRLFELPAMIAPEEESAAISDGGDTWQGNHLGSYAAVVALMGFITLVVVLRRGTDISARVIDVEESELEGALNGLE